MPLRDVLTAQWLQDRYLVGIDLTDDTDTAYPSAIYTHAVESAISLLADTLDVTLDGIKHRVGERHDRLDMDGEGFHFRSLRERPARAVTQLQWKFGNFQGTALPLSWHETIDPIAGTCRVVPSGDSIESAALANFSYSYLTGAHHFTPGWWYVSYRHGFDDRRTGVPLGTFAERFYLNGALEIEPSTAPASGQTFTAVVSGRLLTATETGGIGAASSETLTWSDSDGSYPKRTTAEWSQITSVVFSESGSAGPTFRMTGDYSWPASFEDAIGLTASLLLLDTAGDLILGAGIASKTVSMDGISQSIASTSSATNSGYGARALAYGKRLKTLMGTLEGQYYMPTVFIP